MRTQRKIWQALKVFFIILTIFNLMNLLKNQGLLDRWFAPSAYVYDDLLYLPPAETSSWPTTHLVETIKTRARHETLSTRPDAYLDKLRAHMPFCITLLGSDRETRLTSEQRVLKSLESSDPTDIQCFEALRADFRDQDGLHYIHERIHERMTYRRAVDERRIAGMPDNYRVLYLVDEIRKNFGVSIYGFYNILQRKEQNIDALVALGLLKHAEVVRQLLDRLPPEEKFRRLGKAEEDKVRDDFDAQVASVADRLNDEFMLQAMVDFAKRENILPR